MNVLELIKLVQERAHTQEEQARLLASLADAPGEDFQPKVKLPVQNELPAFRLGDGSVGSLAAGLDYGVPAPVPGSEESREPSIGELLIGEGNATNGT